VRFFSLVTVVYALVLPALGAHFQVLHDRIVTPGDGLIIFQGMQDSHHRGTGLEV
jgi:hypothetical protein